MKYNIATGVERSKRRIKKLTIGIAASTLMAGAAAFPAFAAGEQASPCGAVHGAFLAGDGNYGFLGGEGGTPGYHNANGQEQGATGYNNSHTNCQAAN